jgi:hypothetical protein
MFAIRLQISCRKLEHLGYEIVFIAGGLGHYESTVIHRMNIYNG